MHKILKLFFFFQFSLFHIQAIESKEVINIAVFCSADDKACDEFKQLAFNVGKELAIHKLGLVTGGSKTGLMKAVTDGYVFGAESLESLYGILPQALLPYNVHHQAIPKHNLLWVETIHIRLKNFHELSDVVVILPGGFGTLHELMDFLVHNQFSATKKSIILINYDNYWEHLLQQFLKMKEHLLLADKHLSMIKVVESIEQCMQLILNNNFITADQGLNAFYWTQQQSKN